MDLTFPSVEAPTIPARFDLASLDLGSSQSLYESTARMRRTGEVRWICLSGLCVDSKNHSAFCRAVCELSSLTDAASTSPQLIVLDWGRVEVCSAEGIAFFLILVRWLLEQRMSFVVCSPTHFGVSTALDRGGARTCCGDAVCWIRSESRGVAAVEEIAQCVVLARGEDQVVSTFLDELSASLTRLQLPKATRQLVMGLTHEVFQNVRSYAEANFVAAAAYYFQRRHCLQIGIADDGVGIADTILRQDRHAELDWFSDARIVSLVLRRGLSGRAVAADGTVSGGGMSQLIPVVLNGVRSAIMLRSGRALLGLRSDSPKYPAPQRFNFARGTQFRLEISTRA